jgi:bifunctional UDP-N-acetylglucosamine pyrophosphorylase/glucosamine-1-phosphate N-acetyltransferase
MKIGLILAGGLGKRMGSTLPKVLHTIQSIPMICWVIEKTFGFGCEQIGIIVGKYRDQIKQVVESHYPNDSRIIWIDQPEPLGTAHAVKCALDWMAKSCLDKQPSTSASGSHLELDSDVLIMSGDVPLITTQTLGSLGSKPNSLLVTKLSNPYGYGRVWIDNQTDSPKEIIEEKDCDPSQKQINLVNCGIYWMSLSLLMDIIPQINSSNASNEYYLTDMIKLAYQKGYRLNYYELEESKSIEIANINTKEDLEQLNLRISN